MMNCSARSLLLRAGLAAGLSVVAADRAMAVGNAANLMFPLDGSYSVVPFAGHAGVSGPANLADPNRRNDDDYTDGVAIPFNFNVYGQSFNSVFINNNGNLTFGGGDPTFTPFAFPAAGSPRVAPFFADVDTRNANSGVVHYRVDPHALIVTWDNVGYYNQAADKTNTFQVAISDGTDARFGARPGGGFNNVCFSFDNMDWTTGSASGGVNGFGGSAATAGVNAGNGTDFFAIGRFDHAGADYNGPQTPSGVDFLDNVDVCFNVSGLANQAPIAVGLPGNGCFTVNGGGNLNQVIQFIGPEVGDLVTITGVFDLNGAQADGMSLITSSPGNPALLTLLWNNVNVPNGSVYNFHVDFMDSFGAASGADFCVQVIPAPGFAGLAAAAGLLVARRRRA